MAKRSSKSECSCNVERKIQKEDVLRASVSKNKIKI